MNKILLIGLISIVSFRMHATENDLHLDKIVVNNNELTFTSHRGDGPYDTSLAMNIQYQPVKSLRLALSKWLGYELNFFKLWQSDGEAHITIITPVEYFKYIKDYLSIERIESIAEEMGVQSSDFDILGLGRGEAIINEQMQETYFIIVYSSQLLKIRQQIYKEYLANGGPIDGWNLNEFYPHITVGFSLRDLHISDGVIKDKEHSIDKRFNLSIVNYLNMKEQ